jgi:hypothetical protein
MENEKIPRPFQFDADCFAFANELVWHYQFDPATGRMDFRPRVPKPDYAHRCFVLVRSARQFLYHARWAPAAELLTDDHYRQLVRCIIRRSARQPCRPGDEVIIPGYANLHEFSLAREKLLKEICGGAWRSYVLRSHWRMVFPISRNYQLATAGRLVAALRENIFPIIHLVTFPSLKINHGMIVFAARETGEGTEFSAYDPNHPAAPASLSFDSKRKTFSLPPNHYWAGGDLNVIQIYRNWWM